MFLGLYLLQQAFRFSMEKIIKRSSYLSNHKLTVGQELCQLLLKTHVSIGKPNLKSASELLQDLVRKSGLVSHSLTPILFAHLFELLLTKVNVDPLTLSRFVQFWVLRLGEWLKNNQKNNTRTNKQYEANDRFKIGWGFSRFLSETV